MVETENAAAFLFSPIPIHLWRGLDDPVLEKCNEPACALASTGLRAAEVLAKDPESLVGLLTCLKERRTIELQPVPYIGGGAFAVRHVFLPPDGAMTFVRELVLLNEDIDVLRAAEQKYRSILESVDVVVWQADPLTLQFNYVSSTIERFGYTVEDVMQPGWWVNWLHPDDRNNAVHFCTDQIVDARDHAFEYRAISKDGSIRWIRDIVAVRRREGRTELYGVFVDITDTRMEQEKSRFEHLLLQASFASSGAGMAVVSPDGSIAFHNAALLELFDADNDPSRLAGHPLLTADGNDQYEIELPNGRIVMRSATTINGRGGEPLGHLFAFRDITLERRAEDELRERERHFRSLIEHSFDVICLMDAAGIIEYTSPSIFKALGFTAEELIGTNIDVQALPEDRPMMREAMDRVLRTNSSQEVVVRKPHKNGSVRWFSIVFSTLETKDGLRIVANARDITERRMLETSLEQAHRMTSLGHLAATIAHEMNNVLMAIQPNVEYLARITPDDAKLQRVVKVIEQSVRRGSRTTQEILRFTKPAEPRLQPLDVERWLDDLAGEAASMLGPAIQLRVQLPDEPVMILGEAAALNQALTNLLLNARDAMNGRGGIDITVSDTPSALQDYVQISVRDEGAGMSPAVAERIFEPLFTTKPRGLGLGLAIVHQVVSAHRGLVRVESAEGRGTTFHLFLPRTECAKEIHADTSPVTLRPGLRVLIAEDESAVAAGISSILEMEGAIVRVVDHGHAVLPMIEEFQPAIVVLDVGLPDISGTDVFVQLRERWHALPVIFSTGHADAGRLHQLLAPPLVDVALKPYETSELLRKISDAVQ